MFLNRLYNSTEVTAELLFISFMTLVKWKLISIQIKLLPSFTIEKRLWVDIHFNLICRQPFAVKIIFMLEHAYNNICYAIFK